MLRYKIRFIIGASVIPLQSIREYCIEGINDHQDRETILDIFYVLLKAKGLSYAKVRAAWLRQNAEQLNLFAWKN